jgi:hypothetical protein
MGRILLGSLGLLAAISMAPLAFLVPLGRRRELGLAAARTARRLRRLRRPRPEPEGPPLEVLAVKVRRLHSQLETTPRGSSMPKERGTLAAYDDALVATARALGVQTCLAELPAVGFDRYAERLRLEDALGEAGLVWGPG